MSEASPRGRSTEQTVESIQGELHSVASLRDQSGEVVHRVVTPLMVELRWRDIVQLTVGACVLAIPVAYTEEVWVLGEQLPIVNVVGIAAASFIFMSLFTYFLFYQGHFKGYEFEYAKRIVVGYGVTFSIAATLLTLFGKCPWTIEPLIALKRSVLVTFPACFSATVVDSLK